MRARAAGLRTSSVSTLVRQLNLQVRTRLASLEELTASASAQADKAVSASKIATDTLATMHATAGHIVQEAATSAVEKVEKMLGDEFESLGTWRNQVLRDDYKIAAERAREAAAPYRVMEREAQRATQRFQAQAKASALRARSMAASAEQAEAGAAAKQKAWDTFGAAQEIEAARAMQAQAVQAADLARALQASAQAANVQASLYRASGPMAAANAARTVDPFGMPPVRVDPTLVYLPPQR